MHSASRYQANFDRFFGVTSMPSIASKLAVLAAGLLLAGCMQTPTYEAASSASMTPRDKDYLAKVSYTKATIPEPFRRAYVDYHRKETPGTIVVDSDNHYLYYV